MFEWYPLFSHSKGSGGILSDERVGFWKGIGTEMRRITNDELREILDKHRKWVNEEDSGERAYLCDADLRDANLRYVNLRGAYLRGADLSGTDLRGADLSHSELYCADFRNANLSHADLSHASLVDANLISANLKGANLTGAYLRNANFKFADLRSADLRNAGLIGADFRGARHDDTILKAQCPEEGSFIAWKKLVGAAIAKLLIPEDAKRSSATSRKCRASKAEVLAIYDKYGVEIKEGRSGYDYEFIYRVGETVYPDGWNEDRWSECSNGIHFFMTREEAEEY